MKKKKYKVREARLIVRREKGTEKPAAGTSEAREVEVGDFVTRHPVTLEGYRDGKIHRTLKGRVVYVHPRRRFHVVEFELWGGKVRESFPGVSWEEEWEN